MRVTMIVCATKKGSVRRSRAPTSRVVRSALAFGNMSTLPSRKACWASCQSEVACSSKRRPDLRATASRYSAMRPL
ncbi:hypothetical protein D9M69_660820 [compost metagenome]